MGQSLLLPSLIYAIIGKVQYRYGKWIAMSEENETNLSVPENIFLVFEKQLFPITRTTTNIGRHPHNDLIINDPRISRHHAQLRYENGKFFIYDSNSTFGTFVNQEKVDRAAVTSGDTISFAQTPVLFIDRSSRIIQQTKGTTGMLTEE